MDKIRAKLKVKITGIKIKSASLKKEIKLFEEVTHISSQICAIGGNNELEHDREFIALVLRHLTLEQKNTWIYYEDKKGITSIIILRSWPREPGVFLAMTTLCLL